MDPVLPKSSSLSDGSISVTTSEPRPKGGQSPGIFHPDEEENMKILTRDHIARRYGLSWDANGRAIVVSMHRDILAGLQEIPADSPRVAASMKALNFTSFEGLVERDFGFDGSLKCKDGGDYVTFAGKLPTVFRILDEKCERCKGTGKDQELGGKCFGCSGRKKKHAYEWTPA